MTNENTKKPQNPKPKSYKDYLQDLVDKNEMNQKDADKMAKKCKSINSKYNFSKKTNFR